MESVVAVKSMDNIESEIKKKIKESRKTYKNFPKDSQKDVVPVLNEKQQTILKKILLFFSNEVNKNLIMSIANQETSISLRLLDWLVTNYSKKFNVRYELGSREIDDAILSNKNFNLWLNYKNQLKAYSKKLFDPFCRRQRIFYQINLNEIIC